MRPQRRKESNVHATFPSPRRGSGGGPLIDELSSLDLIPMLLAMDGGGDLRRHAIGGAPINWVEVTRGLRIKHIMLVANGDLRLLPCQFEMVVAFLEVFPEREVWRVAMSRHVERRHPERISLNLK